LIFARIVNVLNEEDGAKSQSRANRRENVHNLWEELQRWRSWRLQSVRPLLRVEQSEKSPFPTIIFVLSASSK
jgi:hypothetical protein